MPRRPGQSPEDRAKDIENGLDWLRGQGLGVESPPGDDHAPVFGQEGQESLSHRSAEDRAKDFEDALKWIRGQGEVDDDALLGRWPSMNQSLLTIDL